MLAAEAVPAAAWWDWRHRPPGFIDEMERLVSQGSWEQVSTGEPFHSMPNGEPEVELRIWLYRVL